jgi:hypothetical protein
MNDFCPGRVRALVTGYVTVCAEGGFAVVVPAAVESEFELSVFSLPSIRDGIINTKF